jgi:L-fuconolactonase
MRETEDLLKHASECSFIRGVVGWFPLAEPELDGLLESYATNPLLKGVRHVVQDEADDQFILGDAFNKGIRRLKAYELVYDILIYERQLGPSIEFVDRHPDQVFVLDHVAKPRIGDQIMEPWRAQMFELAKRENVYCKLSGMATEANWQNWTKDDLWPYAEVAMEAFGPTRMMFGSDWPVARLAVEYGDWVGLCREFISTLSDSEQAMIEGEVAIRAYDL